MALASQYQLVFYPSIYATSAFAAMTAQASYWKPYVACNCFFLLPRNALHSLTRFLYEIWQAKDKVPICQPPFLTTLRWIMTSRRC